jgi:flagellar basal-body rod protein FlgB
MSSEVRQYLFGGVTRSLVYKALDATAIRGRAVSDNIANAATPGYERKEVSFEEQVRAALAKKVQGETTSDAHFEIGRIPAVQKVAAEVYRPFDPTQPGEVNNVDIDLEMAKMAENQIEYNFLIRNAGFDKMQASIKGQTY